MSTIEEVLASLDTESKGQIPKTIPELLGVLEDTVRKRHQEDPEVAAKMYLLAGKAYLSINQAQAADRVLSSANKIYRVMLEKSGESQSEELADVIHNLGRVYFFYGKSALDDASDAKVSGRDEDELEFRAMQLKWFANAVDTYSEALAMRKGLLDSPNFDVAMTTQHLAAAIRELAVATRSMASDSDEENLERVQQYFDDSEFRFNEALSQWHELHGESSSQVASLINSLAQTASVRGRPDVAHARYMEAYEMALKHGTPEDDYRVGRAAKNLAMNHRSKQEWDESIVWLRKALPLLERREEASSTRLLEAKSWLVDSMLRTGQPTSEVLMHARNIEEVLLDPIYEKKTGEKINASALHVDVLVAMGREKEAGEQLHQSCEILGISPDDDPRLEARKILLQGVAVNTNNASEELIAALRTARYRWGR